ncbi:MAG: hypothetical protein HOY71_36810 [Nonomuraea sp.]|nr:hypothetical protein [Nonomuraea sp.]
MAQYAILLYAKAAAGSAEAHDRHAKELLESGVMAAAFALTPAEMATTVSRDTVTDGPFVDAKEVIAGIYVVDAPDLDAALDLARRNPAAVYGGAVEVRPVEGSVIPPR